MKYIDLTHSFLEKMPAYPGDPESSLIQATSIEKEGYTDHWLRTLMHVGTHMDAPLHMIPTGKRMDEIELDKFFGPGVIIDARGKSVIDADLIDDKKIKAGSIVLIYTGYGEKYHDPSYFEGYPSVSENFAQKMVELKVKIVAMDILGPDQPPFLTHKILLESEVLIIENLTNLDQLLSVGEFEVIALPAKLHADAAPVRVVAVVK
jgi:kynurenine formamidase